MQMTKAAAFAILAFTSTAVAQYYGEEYGSIYAREAYPEYDDVAIYARDAYEAGYEAGLYARAPPAPGPITAPKPPRTNADREKWLNKDERKALKKEKGDESAIAKEKAEIAALQAKMNGQQADLTKQKGRVGKDSNRFEQLRTQDLSARDLYDIYDYEW